MDFKKKKLIWPVIVMCVEVIDPRVTKTTINMSLRSRLSWLQKQFKKIDFLLLF